MFSVLSLICSVGSASQVLLVRHKENSKYYAVKVLQKTMILKKKEVSVLGRGRAKPLRGLTVPCCRAHVYRCNTLCLIRTDTKELSFLLPCKAHLK